MRILIIACGALARELVELKRRNRWAALRVQCLPAELHNTPQRIPGAVRTAIERHRADGVRMFVAYGDCGTGGALDRVLTEYGVERLPGAHCYQFFAGASRFERLANDEPGTFYLTDFLVRHFERLVVRGLGLDRHPELRDSYFGNYRRVVYLAQSDTPGLSERARECARYLKLEFHPHRTGLAPLEAVLRDRVAAW